MDGTKNGSSMQAQEFINEYENDDYAMKDEPAEGGRDIIDREIAREIHRADVPLGPSEHDKRVPVEVAQGD